MAVNGECLLAGDHLRPIFLFWFEAVSVCHGTLRQRSVVHVTPARSDERLRECARDLRGLAFVVPPDGCSFTDGKRRTVRMRPACKLAVTWSNSTNPLAGAAIASRRTRGVIGATRTGPGLQHTLLLPFRYLPSKGRSLRTASKNPAHPLGPSRRGDDCASGICWEVSSQRFPRVTQRARDLGSLRILIRRVGLEGKERLLGVYLYH